MQNDLNGYDVIEAIHRNCRLWQPLIEEPPYDEIGVHNFVQHLNWLLPLAEVLQARKILDSLYPKVHHAVIELKRHPHTVRQQEYFTFYAVEEGQFKLSHTRDACDRQNTTVRIQVGSADEVTQALIQLLSFSDIEWQQSIRATIQYAERETKLMDTTKKNQRFRTALLIVGTIFVLGMAYGSGMRGQVKKLQTFHEQLVTARRDLRLSQIDLRASQALAQQLEARRQVTLALGELDKRNFGVAQERLTEAASRLETVQKANDAARTTKPQQPSVSVADFTAIGTQIKQINLVATPNTGTQREQILAIAAQMDTELGKVAPKANAEFAAVTVDPPTLNDVPQLPGNDVTQN